MNKFENITFVDYEFVASPLDLCVVLIHRVLKSLSYTFGSAATLCTLPWLLLIAWLLLVLLSVWVEKMSSFGKMAFFKQNDFEFSC